MHIIQISYAILVLVAAMIILTGCATTQQPILADHAVVYITGNEILLPKTAHRFEQVSNTELYFK